MNVKPFIKKSGNGPALVLLHGWGLHGGIWTPILNQLETEFTVYNVDLPGFGYSPVYNGDYTLDYLVDSVLSVLPEKCFLMGWSMGGLIATKIAIEHSSRVEKLVTVASSPKFVESEGWHGMKSDVLATFIEYLQEDYDGTLIRFLGVQTMGSATQKADIKMLKETVFIHGQPSPKALKGGLEILKDVNLIPLLEKLKVPVLRLYGKLDALVPNKVAVDVEKYLPNSQSKIYRRSAHAPFLSESEFFIHDLQNFLKNSNVLGEVES